MRYFYSKPTVYSVLNNRLYSCDHLVYSECTLLIKGSKGLAVIQQRFNPENKTTYWGPIDPWLVDDILTAKSFRIMFDKYSGLQDENGLYPTLTVRQLMYKVGLKPMKKERWETVFDHADI